MKACMIKTLKQSPVTTRRKFDETFKREAVNNWLTSGKSAAVVASELGLKANRLYAWWKGFGPARRRTSRRSWKAPCARTALCGSSATF